MISKSLNLWVNTKLFSVTKISCLCVVYLMNVACSTPPEARPLVDRGQRIIEDAADDALEGVIEAGCEKLEGLGGKLLEKGWDSINPFSNSIDVQGVARTGREVTTSLPVAYNSEGSLVLRKGALGNSREARALENDINARGGVLDEGAQQDLETVCEAYRICLSRDFISPGGQQTFEEYETDYCPEALVADVSIP